MDTHILEGFLLATAQEPWDYWYSDTRLIFADFLDESGRHAEALELRTMEVVIADEISTKDHSIWNIELFGDLDARDEAADFVVERIGGESPISLLAIAINLRARFRWADTDRPIFADALRIVCRSNLQQAANYQINAGEGNWAGTLSLNRARLRCRRRVIDMIPEGPIIVNRRADAPLWTRIFFDDSPRWVPNQIPPEAQQRMREAILLRREIRGGDEDDGYEHEREQQIEEAFFGSDAPHIVGGDPTEPRQD